ncbi:MarR family transcriptional regulator [Acuticoccus sp. MNP-M23]|uniref:MarR family winged helix-turn-helix transcriptional regulator n=1 Tax=Acuticoccus sp. MNP-M23 TaxID=3072793 RepID=UPI00281646EE|nr:MarR family transcriptional regulator [Acuticoccus sp. MNP-M23]WMS43299.1 MarR family transcriptional regulator [Acuticoccus sp. MNP-M23]
MPFQYSKTTIYRLTQAAKAQRSRFGTRLSGIGLHPGQEGVLKALTVQDGMTMSELAAELGVQPPTVTKMVTRLAAYGFVMRQTSPDDGRLSRVHLTEPGRALIGDIDKICKRLEKEALEGFDEKDRKRFRKYLRKVEKNLLKAGGAPIGPDSDDDEDDTAEDATT